MISLLLTLILGFASDWCNNKDIILILGYNYNFYPTEAIHQRIKVWNIVVIPGV